MTPLAHSRPDFAAPHSSPLAAGGGRWCVVPTARWRWQVAPGVSLNWLDGAGEPCDAKLTEVVKRGPHRTTWRLVVAGIPCYLKLSRSRSWAGWLRGRLQGWPAEREFRRLGLLAEAGLPVPRPLAVGRPAGPGGSGSWLLTAEVAGRPLDEIAPPERRPESISLSRTQRNGLVRALARLLVQLHAAGFRHRDLHAGNVLWQSEDDEARDPRLTFVDVAAIEPCMGQISDAGRWHDLIQLRHSLCLAATRAEQLRFVRIYLREALLIDPARDRQRYRQILRELTSRADRYSRVAWAKADRKWARGNRRCAIVRGATKEVRGLARLGLPLLERLADAGNPPTSESPATWRWLELADARRVWELGHALLRRGVRVAEPLVLVQPADGLAGWVAFAARPAEIVGRSAATDASRLLDALHRRGYACPCGWREEFGEDQHGRLALNPQGLAWLAQATVYEDHILTPLTRAA